MDTQNIELAVRHEINQQIHELGFDDSDIPESFIEECIREFNAQSQLQQQSQYNEYYPDDYFPQTYTTKKDNESDLDYEKDHILIQRHHSNNQPLRSSPHFPADNESDNKITVLQSETLVTEINTSSSRNSKVQDWLESNVSVNCNDVDFDGDDVGRSLTYGTREKNDIDNEVDENDKDNLEKQNDSYISDPVPIVKIDNSEDQILKGIILISTVTTT